jgi:hypothetical protein
MVLAGDRAAFGPLFRRELSAAAGVLRTFIAEETGTPGHCVRVVLLDVPRVESAVTSLEYVIYALIAARIPWCEGLAIEGGDAATFTGLRELSLQWCRP